MRRLFTNNCIVLTDIDECASNQHNLGTCTDGVNQYVCGCVAGYTGANCETSKLFLSTWINHFGSMSLCYHSTVS